MLKPCTLLQMKGFLTILGLQSSSSKGDFETWEGKSKVVILCVSESQVPCLAISAILNDVGETEEAFTRIVNVIN